MSTDLADLAVLEDRIRAATRAAAAEITPDSIGPLRLQPRRAGAGRRRSRRRPEAAPGGTARADGRPGTGWRRRLVPLAAAASVLAVLGGLVTLAAHPPGTSAASFSPAATGRSGSSGRVARPAVRQVQAAPLGRLEHIRNVSTAQRAWQSVGARRTADVPAATMAAIPAYYMTLTSTAPASASGGDAAVYSSRTGSRIAAVAPPGELASFVQVSAAADDRTFALAAQYRPARPARTGGTVVQAAAGTAGSRPSPAQRQVTVAGARGLGAVPELRQAVSAAPARRAWMATVSTRVVFYIARFDPSGRSIRLSAVPRLATPAGTWLDGIALSPDGTHLAVALQHGPGPDSTAEIQVASVATGQARSWAGPPGEITPGYPQTLSWTANGTTLAFNWSASGRAGRQPGLAAAAGLRLLPVRAPPGGLLARSRLALHWSSGISAVPGGLLANVAQITPDGRTILAALGRPAVRTVAPGGAGLEGYAAFSAATGALRYVQDFAAVRGGDAAIAVLWASSSGSTLIVAYPLAGGRIAVLRDGLLTPLPQPAAARLPMATW
jgi:hypothetical protein